MLLLDAFVPGVPRPKGSLQPQQVRAGGQLTGRVRLVDSPQSKLWRRTMALAFGRPGPRVFRAMQRPWDGPVVVALYAAFAPCCKESIWDEPHVGDLDKLLRNVYDALQDAQVYGNDRQVVRDGESRKGWGAADQQGARIIVWGQE